jgi:hypothetical protein
MSPQGSLQVNRIRVAIQLAKNVNDSHLGQQVVELIGELPVRADDDTPEH